MSKNHSFLGATGAIAFGVILTLALAEGITRLFYEPAPERIQGLALKFSEYYRSDPELGWVPRPNISANYIRFPATFETNSQGLRDREYQQAKPEGSKRIVVIGDSHTWGYGVNNDETYTEKLEALLPNTEVINLGVTAYSLWQEIAYFKRVGLAYEPDVLIVGFTQNDVDQGANRRNIERANNPPKDPEPDEDKGQRSVQRYIAEHSALYKFVSDRVNTNRTLISLLVDLGVKAPLAGINGIDNNLKTALRDYSPELEKEFAMVRDKLLELKQTTDQAGVRLIVVAIPAKQAIDQVAFEQSIMRSVFEPDDFDLDKPYRLLATFAEEAGFEFVDPVPAFRERASNPEVLYLKRDVHLNAAGHEALARVLAAYLRDSSS